MITDLDIYRAANMLIKRHGDEAADWAASRADDLSAAGYEEGHAVWQAIWRAVTELLSDQPPPGARVHCRCRWIAMS